MCLTGSLKDGVQWLWLSLGPKDWKTEKEPSVGTFSRNKETAWVGQSRWNDGTEHRSHFIQGQGHVNGIFSARCGLFTRAELQERAVRMTVTISENPSNCWSWQILDCFNLWFCTWAEQFDVVGAVVSNVRTRCLVATAAPTVMTFAVGISTSWCSLHRFDYVFCMKACRFCLAFSASKYSKGRYITDLPWCSWSR